MKTEDLIILIVGIYLIIIAVGVYSYKLGKIEGKASCQVERTYIKG